jgi:hypothetical protein
MKTQSKYFKIRIVKREEGLYEIFYSNRYKSIQGGYDWATGNDRFLFENNSFDFGSYDVLPRLCVRLGCTEKEILNFIKKSI